MAGENEEPLLQPPSSTQPPPTTTTTIKPTKTRAQKAIRKTFKGTTKLSSLLPTGSVLIFEMLSPVLTKKGQCKTLTDQALTTLLLLFCSATCFLMCFTDSFLDPRGKVHYGLATFKGLWVVDGLVRLEPDEAAKYRIRFLDFVHGVATVMVFVAVVSLNKDVVKCMVPGVSGRIQSVVASFPVGVGTVCSLLFVWFPSKRNGVANPVSRHKV